MNKFVCNVCGYVYETELTYDEIDENFLCPICSVTKEEFTEEV